MRRHERVNDQDIYLAPNHLRYDCINHRPDDLGAGWRVLSDDTPLIPATIDIETVTYIVWRDVKPLGGGVNPALGFLVRIFKVV